MRQIWRNILWLLCSCCICASAQGANLDPESHAYLLDMKYAKNIEVNAYLVTRDQLAKIFSDDKAEVVQKTNKELFEHETYLLVRCKNTGEYRSFGTLNCKLSKDGNLIRIDIRRLSGNMNFFSDTVLPMGRGIVQNDNKKPMLIFEWKNLYTI